MTKFQYREVDNEGWETLDVISEADKFNEWMYSTIKPFCSGKILEIGSGIGNISQFFVNSKADITLSDIRANYCTMLKEKFPMANDVVRLDLTHPEFDTEYKPYLLAFNTVFALNVVEHIKDHDLAIKNCYKLLQPGGKAIILVPAYQALYNRFDEMLEHFRRYTSTSLNALMTKSGLEVIHSQYFNFMGVSGWFISGKLQRNKTIPKGQMALYNKLVPLFRIIDKLVFNKFGLSVISVGLKK